MADNLSITVTADTASARAQIELLKAEVRALGPAIRQSAAELRTAGADAKAGLTTELNALVGSAGKAEASIRSLKSTLADAARGSQGFSGMLAGIGEVKGALAGMAAAFEVERILGWAKGMAEAGERAENTAAALSMPIGKYIQLAGAMRLAGADAEVGIRTIEHLQKSVSEGLGGNEKMLDNFQRLGITQKQLQATGGDLAAVFKLIAGTLEEHQGFNTAAAVQEILGTRLKAVIGFLREGPGAIDAWIKKFDDLNPSAKAAAEAGASTALKIREVGVAADQVSDAGFLRLKDTIDGALVGAKALLLIVEGFSSGKTVPLPYKMPSVPVPASNLPNLSYLAAGSGSLGKWLFGPEGVTYGNDAFGHHGEAFGPPGAVPARGGVADRHDEGAPPKSDIKPPPAGGKGGGGKGSDDFGSEMRLRIAEAQDNVDKIEAIYQEWLARQKQVYGQESKEYRQVAIDKIRFEKQAQAQHFAIVSEQASTDIAASRRGLAGWKASMDEMVALGLITGTKAVGFEIQKNEQIFEANSHALQELYGLMNETPAEVARINRLVEELNAEHEERKLQLKKDYAVKGKAEIAKFAEPLKQAFDKIGSGLETAITDVLLRKNNQNWGKQLYQSLVGSLVSGAGGIASRAAAGPLGSLLGTAAKPGEGIGDVLGNAAGGWVGKQLGIGDLFGAGAQTGNTAALSANTAALLGLTTAMGGTAAASVGGGAASLAGGAGAAAGGGGIFGWLGSLLAFEKGGIVSAAGGFQVPSGLGATPALLHAREMVLPAGERPSYIAESLRGMIRAGGDAGGGGDTHIHPTVVINGPADAAQVARFFRNNDGHIGDALRRAFRSNALTPRSF